MGMPRKAPEDRNNNITPRHPDTWIVWDGQTRGPELDDADLDGSEWCEQTRKWWNWLRNSPQAMLIQESDWWMLKMAARVHHGMHTRKEYYDKSGNLHMVQPSPGEMTTMAKTFASLTDTYGLTRQSRQKYGINIVTPEELETEAVQNQIKASKNREVIDYRQKFTERHKR